MPMASAAVDHHDLHFESLPFIDIRVLSQSELLSLSLCSSRAPTTTTSSSSQDYDEEEVPTPKIDRSVFNESAGSRKQTFSRLRLSRRNSSQFSPKIPFSPARVEPLDEDNSKIICLLKSFLNIQSHTSNTIDIVDIDNNEQLVPVKVEYCEYWNANANVDENEGFYNLPVGVVTCSVRKRKRGRPRKDEVRSENWWVIESEYKLKESKGELSVVSENSLNIPVNVNVVACETGKRKPGRPRKNENRNEIKLTVVGESSPTAVAGEIRKRGPGRPRKDESKNGNKYIKVFQSGNNTKKEIVVGENTGDWVKEAVIENRDGVVVDLVALANMEDPFGEELRRRTEGFKKREEFLDFLMGLRGEWVSIRKKRKIVDASELGNTLPRGWKLMLCIKKKVGHMWLGCRRYIRFFNYVFIFLLCVN